VVTAYILIQTEVGKAAKVTTEIVDITGVQQAQAVTGPYDVIVRAEARNLDELGQLVVARVQAVDGITQDPHLSDRAPGLGLWGTVGHRPAASAGQRCTRQLLAAGRRTMVTAGTAASPPTITAHWGRRLAWTCAARAQAGQADACPCSQAGDLAGPPQAEVVVTRERAGDHNHHGNGRGE
jgi:Lrp/AsnC ligand binding domain